MASIINSDDGVISGTAGLKSTGANDGALNIQTNGTNAITVSSAQTVAINGNNISAVNSLGFRNRIINGDMRIDQRNAGAAVTQNASGIYTVDRFAAFGTVTSKFTVQRSTTAPAGFINSALITSSSAYSVTSSDQYAYFQAIEGLNVADLGWGTANAQTITVSFWVRSSLTGTFGGSLRNNAANRSYPFTYTISAANTWEQKTVTIAGDTSGTWLTDNGIGMYLTFSMGAGSTLSGTAGAWAGANYVSTTGATSVVGTNGATWYITGVQLEVGSVATPFERRDYGRELMMCQRYYYKISALSSVAYFTTGWCETTTTANGVISFPVSMRTNPTNLEQSGTASHYRLVDAASGIACSIVPSFAGGASANSALLRFDVASGLTVGRCVGFGANSSTSAYLAWSVEL